MPFSVDAWGTQPPDPVRVAPALLAAAQVSAANSAQTMTLPETTTVDRWIHFSEYRVLGNSPLPTAAIPFAFVDPNALTQKETTTVDRWLHFSEYRVLGQPPLPIGAMPFFGIDPNALTQKETTTVDRWLHLPDHTIWPQSGLSISAVPFLSSRFAPVDVLPRFHPAPNEPIRGQPPLSVAAINNFTISAQGMAVPERPTADRWFHLPETPVWGRAPLTVGAMPTAATISAQAMTLPESPSVDRWFRLPDHTIWPKAGLLTGAIPFFPAISPQALTLQETMLIDRWFHLPEHTIWPRRELLAAAMPALSAISPQALGQIEALSWFRPTNEPIRALPPLPVGTIMVFAISPTGLTTGESPTADRWFHLPEAPLFWRPPLSVAAMPTAATISAQAMTLPESPSVDRWFHLPDHTIWPKSGLLVGNIPFVSAAAPLHQAEALSWYRPTNEPIRSLAPLPTGAIAVFAISPQNMTAAETVTADRWLHFSEYQVLGVPPLLVAAFPFAAIIDPVAMTRLEATTVDRWFHLPEWTVWGRPPLPSAAMPASIATDPNFFALEGTRLDRWWHPPELPVWVRQPLVAARIFYSSIDPLAFQKQFQIKNTSFTITAPLFIVDLAPQMGTNYAGEPEIITDIAVLYKTTGSLLFMNIGATSSPISGLRQAISGEVFAPDYSNATGVLIIHTNAEHQFIITLTAQAGAQKVSFDF